MRARLLVIGATLSLLSACGDDKKAPAPAPDAGAAQDAQPAPDAAPPPALTVHYHRPRADYAGWSATVSGDSPVSSVAASGTDEFGLVFEVPLAEGASSLLIQFVQGGQVDPAQALPVDVGQDEAIWHYSGDEKGPRRRGPPALPGPDQVLVHYLRSDTAYTGWGLHLWGDVKEETLWSFPAQPTGTDPEYGAYWLVDTKPSAARVNVIVHKGDVKDPGPDMGWDVAELGDIVFLQTGTTRITPFPLAIPEFAINGAKAHWLTSDTLAWAFDDKPATRFELRWSPAGDIKVQGPDVVGGEILPLTRDAGGLAPNLRFTWPHLAMLPALKVAAGESLAAALGGQVVVVARDDTGAALAATEVQLPGVLDALYAYDGPLGVELAGRVPTVRVWAPTAQAVRLLRFNTNLQPVGALDLTRGPLGVWSVTGTADWYGTYYQYEVRAYHPASGRVETMVTTDPYSLNVSAGGRHTQIIDLTDPATKPAGWDALVLPARRAPEDVVIYELHVRDFSAHDTTVPAAERGKFLAFTRHGLGGAPESQGMRHLKALAGAGLSTLHLLPSFDVATIPERAADRVDLDDGFDRLCTMNPMVPTSSCAAYGARPIREVMAGLDPLSGDAQQVVGWMRARDSFNWGYDPLHYTVPEGSYASDPQGAARIVELRSAVKALAEVGLRVALDVVYNHTNAAGLSDNAVLDKLVPGYYHRRNSETGIIEQSTCCPNTATEHHMMERLMVDSLVTWARHYKITTFRFDLMGHHMKRNMVKVQETLRALTPATDGVNGAEVYLYGEGWNFGEVANNARGENATQLNLRGTGIGTFSDRLRDAVRGGGPFDSGRDLVANQGFINGLLTDPNADAPPMATARQRALLAADQIKVGLAGNLRTFRLVSSAGTVEQGAFIPYNGQPCGYTDDPQEVITYVSKHDNQTLFDINQYKLPTGTAMAERVRVQNLGFDFVLLGQGVPFLHAGDDLLRSKSMERDSYDSGDWFNRIDWTGAGNNWKVGLPSRDKDLANWPWIRDRFADASISAGPAHTASSAAHLRELLRVRFSTPLFRLETGAEVRTRVDFHNAGPSQIPGLIVMSITDGTCAGADLDPAVEAMVVLFNTTKSEQRFTVPMASGFVLHPQQATSADPVVRGSSFSAGEFRVPARTSAVFWKPQAGAQGDGLPCNTR